MKMVIVKDNETKQELSCEFIRIDPDIFMAINEIFRHIKQSLNHLNKISVTLLRLEFKSDTIKSRTTKSIFKKNIVPLSTKLPDFTLHKNNGIILCQM